MRAAYDSPTIYAAEAQLLAQVPEGSLMAVASRGLARVVREILAGRVRGARVAVIVGSGNNGGDALFAGAELARRGAQVVAVTVADRWHEAGAESLVAAGGRLVAGTSAAATAAVGTADVVVDGIVGIGATGPLREPAAGLVRAVDPQAVVVAADIPSGVDPSSGAVPDPHAAVSADVTVTFGEYKSGQFLPPGRDRCGVLELVDIGLRPVLTEHEPAFRVMGLSDVHPFFAAPGEDDYKYSHGVLGVVAGCAQYPGAPHMVTGAARHAGVGMVRLWQDPTAPQVAASVVSRFPDTVCTSAIGDAKVTAWVVGPGMGTDAGARDRVAAALDTELPLVVDADALTLLSQHAELRTAVRERAAVTVLTPHVGEFERLGFTVGPDRLAAARAAAADLGAIVLLKGPGTVVAAPAGPAFVDVFGTAALATAGTGDALSGLIGAALARQPEAGAAAVAAAVAVHGLAGRIGAADGFPMTAWDLVAAVPKAVMRVREVPAAGAG